MRGTGNHLADLCGWRRTRHSGARGWLHYGRPGGDAGHRETEQENTMMLKARPPMTLCAFVLMTALAPCLGCIMPGATLAQATAKPDPLAGRWVFETRHKSKTVDIAHCGEKWCGVEVDERGTCGHTSFHFSQDTYTQGYMAEYNPVEGTDAHYTRMFIEKNEHGIRIELRGYSYGGYEPYSRSYPRSLSLLRIGEAVCKPEVS
jgi:hypothetical protein